MIDSTTIDDVIFGGDSMAGESTARVSRSVSIAGVTVGGAQQTIATDGQVTFSKVIPANQTDAQCNVNADLGGAHLLAIEASKDCTVKTNSSSTPIQTLSLKANIPRIWVQNDVTANWLTSDISALYVTTGGEDTTLKFVAAIDTSPLITTGDLSITLGNLTLTADGTVV